MPCYFPLRAYQCADGTITFAERRSDIVREIQLPCGKCIGCKLERSRQWAIRCMHEAALYTPENAFITLTYSDENLPYRNQLVYRDFQLFMKRLRKNLNKPLRFYMCGEYGGEFGRPHFHALIFGEGFYADRKYWSKGSKGAPLYRSARLESTWGLGFASLGNVTFQSAAYIARYCTKKITGFPAQEHYTRADADGVYQLVPEFNRMSLKPGIGFGWYQKFKSDVYPHDYVVVDGIKMKPPRYYDKLYAKETIEHNGIRVLLSRIDDIEYQRYVMSQERKDDNIPERLEVKAAVAYARLNLKGER